MCDWSVSPILAMAYTVYGIRITSMLKTFWCTKMVGHPETALGLFGPVQRQRLNRLISLSQNPALFSCADDMITKSGQICIRCADTPRASKAMTCVYVCQ